MQITLDLDQLLSEGKISQTEYEKLNGLAARSTASLVFNVLIGFGVIAVSGAALALVPAPTTAIAIGLLVLIGGLILLRRGSQQWKVLANVCILVGALMTSGGVVTEAEGSRLSILWMTVLLAGAGIFARSTLLAVFATLMLSASLGARTGYFYASHYHVMKEPTMTVVLFSGLAIGLYQLSKMLAPAYERMAVASARASVFLVNFGFWVGSLRGDRSEMGAFILSNTVFAVLWALVLLGAAVWACKHNHRWVLNTVATFGGIHFYTQWFERLGASPVTVLVAGLLTLGFAVGLRSMNNKMKEPT